MFNLQIKDMHDLRVSKVLYESYVRRIFIIIILDITSKRHFVG